MKVFIVVTLYWDGWATPSKVYDAVFSTREKAEEHIKNRVNSPLFEFEIIEEEVP